MADDLAAVLELLHDSDRRWRTLRAQGDQWADPDRSREAFFRAVRPGSVVSSRGTPGPDDRDPTWKLWLAPPQFRSDFGGPHQSRSLLIGDGHRLCYSHPAADFLRVTDQQEEKPQIGPAGDLLESSALLSVLRVEVEGRRSVLGREVVVVRGRPRLEAKRRGPRLFFGADEVVFAVDAERGILLWRELWLDGAPYQRLAMTSVAFDEELDPALFEFPDVPDVHAPSLPVPGRPRRPAPHPRLGPSGPRSGVVGPPDEVLGEPVGGRTVVARTDTLVVAVDRIVAYPGGFELGVTVRTRDAPVHGSFDDHRQRAWSGVSAFPGESIRVSVVFADGRRGEAGNFGPAPAGAVKLLPIQGHGSQTRFDQRYWVEPLPPPGPLGVVVEWERRGLAETRAELDAGAILDAAAKVETLWP